jgi:hypothetical protein
MKHSRRAAALMAALVLAGCASSSPSPSATPQLACTTVTAGDIALALGGEVAVAEGHSQPEPSDVSPGRSLCHYGAEEWGGVTVELVPEAGAEVYAAALAATPDAEEFDLGDAAFWSSNTSRGYLLQGSASVMVQVTYLVDTTLDRGALARSLLETALARLEAGT